MPADKPKKTILITGANGQVGSEFQALSANFPACNFLFTDRTSLLITDESAVQDFFAQNHIDICINCAAYTAVDKAEQEKELAEKVNAAAVGYLAKACKDHDAAFIHISTDYVFDGKASDPYMPDDKTHPVNYYGLTKLEGEKLALQLNNKTIIIRTAWVYSSYGKNFVKTMLRLMKERGSIGVVEDQRGSPTYAGDLAAAIMHIIDTNNFAPGIYHYTNEGVISWFGFAKEIASLIKTSCVIHPIDTLKFPTPAARPAYSVLDTEKIKTTFHLFIPPWQDSLQKCITLLRAE